MVKELGYLERNSNAYLNSLTSVTIVMYT